MVQKINTVVVGLAHNELDKEIINYINFLGETTEAKMIHFVNVVNLHLPAKVLAEFPNLEQEALNERQKEVEKLVKKHCHLPDTMRYDVSILQSSNKLKGLIEAIGKFDADLVVVGRSKNKERKSVVTQRLARRAPCQVLIVPEGSYERLKHRHGVKTLLVPIDFSDYSAMALERAIDIARLNKKRLGNEVKIICQHVFTLPSGYHLSGKTEEEFAEIMKKNAQASYEEFIKEIDTKGTHIEVVYSQDTNDDLTSDIRDLATELDVDGIIIGSKGRTATAAFFLGSTAENLITNNTQFTLLVVRKKRDYDGILDRIKKL